MLGIIFSHWVTCTPIQCPVDQWRYCPFNIKCNCYSCWNATLICEMDQIKRVKGNTPYMYMYLWSFEMGWNFTHRLWVCVTQYKLVHSHWFSPVLTHTCWVHILLPVNMGTWSCFIQSDCHYFYTIVNNTYNMCNVPCFIEAFIPEKVFWKWGTCMRTQLKQNFSLAIFLGACLKIMNL